MNLSVKAAPPDIVDSWLQVPQQWQRDTDSQIISLGKTGEFDDTHIFAPAVALENDKFSLWYCGSTASVAERVFQLGLAVSLDGRKFTKNSNNPVLAFQDGKRSILTPALLRNADGSTLRENGNLRMWFSATHFAGESNRHRLHESVSKDGIHWQAPSTSLLENVYSPSIIKVGRDYRMWFIDVSKEPWLVKHASSRDGRKWRVTPEPVLIIDQKWEKERLFYPSVIKIDGVYLMWYGSYWSARPQSTALGFAVSLNGLKWYKHPENPVLIPDISRVWESHYVTSQSVMRLEDGSYRIWYASRKKPPFKNKYYAINTALWKKSTPASKRKLTKSSQSAYRLPGKSNNVAAFSRWKKHTQLKLRKMLGIPHSKVPLNAVKKGEFAWNGIVVEKWIFTSERGSKVPAVLYRPVQPKQKMPAIVLTFGHGGSKSQWQYNYAGQLYAKLGLACLAIDPIGEEERHHRGRLGTRAHDPKAVSDRADKANRLIMGKLLFDTMRGIDFLYERDDIDLSHIGVAGNSLGGAVAGWMAALEPRICLAIVSGWAFHDVSLRTKYCTRLPNERMREHLSWADYASLAAPNCTVLLMNGDADWIISQGNPKVWRETNQLIDQVSVYYYRLKSQKYARAWLEKQGGHRPYFAYQEALQAIHHDLGTPRVTLKQIQQLQNINSGKWCDMYDIQLEKLYGTQLHQRGASLPDMDIIPIPKAKLACLEKHELGQPEFTIEGWLKQIEKQATQQKLLSPENNK